MRILVVGLDCAAPALLFGDERLVNFRRLAEAGCYGRLESSIPPITVPAWMCMATSQDPGSLGVYGFRNRADHSYGELKLSTSKAIQELAIWDQVARSGGKSVLIGVPPNYPPRQVNGISVGCFLTPDDRNDSYTYPPEVKAEIRRLVGEYPVDVKGFRTDNKEWLKDEIYAMSRKHFAVVRHFLQNAPWDYFQFVEIGVDRVHHGFWKYWDKTHRQYAPGNPYENVIPEYYRYLDDELGSILELLSDDTIVLVASDHGAQRLDGGFCINEWLVREGLLVLDEYPREITPPGKLKINWAKTTAWSEGGYYARVFLNVKGREPQGLIDAGDYERVRDDLKIRLEAAPDDRGKPLGTCATSPKKSTATCGGSPPICWSTWEISSGDRSAAWGTRPCTCRKTTPARTIATTPSTARSSWLRQTIRCRARSRGPASMTSPPRSWNLAATTSPRRCRDARLSPDGNCRRPRVRGAGRRRPFGRGRADPSRPAQRPGLYLRTRAGIDIMVSNEPEESVAATAAPANSAAKSDLPIRGSSLLTLSVWFGAVAGAIEGIIIFFLHRCIWKSNYATYFGHAVQILWIPVLVDACLFGSAGLAAWALSRLVPRRLVARWLIWLLEVLVLLSWLIPPFHERIRMRGLIVLAIGIATVLVPWIRKRKLTLLEASRRRLGWLVLGIVAWVGAIQCGEWITERVSWWLLPPSPSHAPNVLIVVIDTLRADYLKCYGYPRDTSPNLDSLASEGTLFEQCYAAGSWTPPSHASMLSGQPVHVHRCDENNIDNSVPVLPETMTKLGYRTAAFTANQYYFSQRQGFGRGFQRFEDEFQQVDEWFTKTAFGAALMDSGILRRWFNYRGNWSSVNGDYINGRYLRWLDAGSKHPSFAILNYMDVHAPYRSPEPFRSRFEGELVFTHSESEIGRSSGDEVDLQPRRNCYAGCVAHADDCFGHLLRGLKDRGLLDNTLVIVTSDHGEMLGDHHLLYHGSNLYSQVLHVPLIMRWPWHVPAGVRVDAVVSNRALASSILSMLGTETTDPFPDPPLTRLWQYPSAGEMASCVCRTATQAVRVRQRSGPLWIDEGPDYVEVVSHSECRAAGGVLRPAKRPGLPGEPRRSQGGRSGVPRAMR